MRILIKNPTILPMTEKGLYFRKDLAIEDGKIEYIGEIPESFKPDKTIDAEGKLLLPAFINAHTHLSMGLMRNYKDNCSNLMDWLSEIWPIEDKLNGNDIYNASLLGVIELIRSGCTLFSDMYFFQPDTVRAIRKAGTRAVIGQTLFGDGEETERRLREVYPEIIKAIDGDERFRVDIAPHAIYTCSSDTYTKAREYSDKLGCMVNTHLSETQKEVDDCLAEHGKTPLMYLKDINAVTPNMYLAHGVHLTDEELDLCHDMNISIVHNPSSNAKLASGTLSVANAMKHGVNVALGTDGASSNNNLDMLEEMHLAAMMATAENGVPSLVSAYDVISMATINGAKALHLDDKLGTVEVGKDADLILIDTECANMTPLNDPFSAVVFSASSENIDTVISFGKIIMLGRKLMTLNEKEILRNARDTWEDLKNR